LSIIPLRLVDHCLLLQFHILTSSPFLPFLNSFIIVWDKELSNSGKSSEGRGVEEMNWRSSDLVVLKVDSVARHLLLQ
jgi:hypothetical protein